MRCEEAAEFVSPLCDGETIPRPAAEHIGECEVCRGRLKEYAEMGAELRRVASLEPMEWARVRRWEKSERAGSSWWRKGWATMRIPRLVFALLLVAIVVMGSTLAIVRARAHTQRGVLMLTAKIADGKSIRCPLSIEDKNSARCASMDLDRVYGFRVITDDGDRVELGVRMGLIADLTGGALTYENIDRLPERQYSFQPGKKLEIAVPGAGTMLVTGEMMDHMPSLITSDPDEQVDPKPDELRFVSPVLLRGKEVVFDLAGASAITREKRGGIELYAPGEGLFHISLLPLEGAVEGRIAMSRVSFELDGQPYMFLLAAPVARGEQLWILRDASYKPSDSGLQAGFLGSCDESHLLARAPEKD